MQPGDIFENKYRIESKIGQGGFASVYLARHVDLGHRVAIKVLERDGAEPRFLREGQILARLKSPYTVRILDFGRCAGQSYLVSEFIEGEPLSSVITRGPLPWSDVESIIRQILLSLAEAHQAGVVHRDVKLANIMRLPDGSVRVLDFGVAKVRAVDELTKSGAVVGTIRYMAPENLLGSRDATPAVDVFAVGLIAVAVLTGAQPFAGDSTHEIVQRLMSDETLRVPATLHLPRRVRLWIEHLLVKDPAGRPMDAAAALDGLDRAIATAPQTESMSRLPAWATLVTVFVLVAGGGLLWLRLGRDRATSPTPPPPPIISEPPAGSPGSVGISSVAEAWELGLTRFQAADWVGSLREFRKVESEPATPEAKRLTEGQYVRKAIDHVIEQPPSAQSEEDLEAVLAIYPGDEAARDRLARLRVGKRSKPTKRRKITIDRLPSQGVTRSKLPRSTNDTLFETEEDRLEWERKSDALKK